MTKIAVVTGGSSGIGLAIAKELGKRGYALILVARGAKRLGVANRELHCLGYLHDVLIHDVAHDPETLARRIREISWCLGSVSGCVDILVHCAGVTVEVDSSAKAQADCYDINVIGTKNVLKASEGFLCRLGHIAVFSSLAGLIRLPGISEAYSDSKRVVQMVVERRRQYFGERQATMSLVYPPVVDTPMVSALRCTAPIYRAFPWMTAEEVAKVAVEQMLAGKSQIHFSLLYAFLAKVIERAPWMEQVISGVLRVYIPLVASFKKL